MAKKTVFRNQFMWFLGTIGGLLLLFFLFAAADPVGPGLAGAPVGTVIPEADASSSCGGGLSPTEKQKCEEAKQ